MPTESSVGTVSAIPIKMSLGVTINLKSFNFGIWSIFNNFVGESQTLFITANRMPKIFEYFGFIFYFYSNEHEPIHVHVLHGGRALGLVCPPELLGEGKIV